MRLAADWRWQFTGLSGATKDIDFLIREEDLSSAFAAARTLGYDIEGLPLDFDSGQFKLRRLSKINEETKSLLTVDFILVTEKISDVWNGREHVEWGSGSAWVVSRDGLIKMKRNGGRDQDLVDIRRLEESDDEDKY